jgi:hypothetical protein
MRAKDIEITPGIPGRTPRITEHLHLNDLGYSLLEAGQYAEAESVLQRAVQLAPPEYDLAKGNLEHLREVRTDHP